MENLQYNGENVYTHSTNRVTPTELVPRHINYET